MIDNPDIEELGKRVVEKMEEDNELIFEGLREVNPTMDERSVIIIYGAVIDFYLEKILKQSVIGFKEKLFEFNQPLGTFSSRIEISFALGLIDENLYRTFTFIRKIRNKCAHNIKIDITLSPISNWINEIVKIYKPYSSYFEEQRENLKNSNELFYKQSTPKEDFTPNNLRLILHLLLARLLRYKAFEELGLNNKSINLLPSFLRNKEHEKTVLNLNYSWIEISGDIIQESFKIAIKYMKPQRDILKTEILFEFQKEEVVFLKGFIKYVAEIKQPMLFIKNNSDEMVFTTTIKSDELNSFIIEKIDNSIKLRGNTYLTCFELLGNAEGAKIKIGAIRGNSNIYMSECLISKEGVSSEIVSEYARLKTAELTSIEKCKIVLMNNSPDTYSGKIFREDNV